MWVASPCSARDAVVMFDTSDSPGKVDDQQRDRCADNSSNAHRSSEGIAYEILDGHICGEA